MKGAVYRHDVPRYLVSRAVRKVAPRAWSPRLAPISLSDIPPPEPSRPGWVRLKVRLCGICGSDVHILTGEDSLYLEPEATYPFTPGHEIVGEVESASPEAALPRGQRVAVWVPLGCRARGFEPPCPRCSEGFDGLCERRDEGWPGPGLSIGFNRDTGGGWAEACLAHESQLRPLPEAVSDRNAVLLDPAATALAALLRTEDPRMERTLIIGGGTIGLLAARLAVALERPGAYDLLVRHPFQAEKARALAIPVHRVSHEAEFRDWAAGQGMSSRLAFGYGPIFRGRWDRVIDTAGTASSLAWSLACARPGGQVVLVAAADRLRRFDPTPLWYREMRLSGIHVYGPVPWEGGRRHPFDILIPGLAAGTLKFEDLVTHRFPIGSLYDALAAAAGRARSRAVKVVIEPGPPAS